MRLRPYSIYSKDKHPRLSGDACDYSNDLYEGVRCGYDRNDCPVVVMHCKRDDPLRWKVVYGFSTVFFRTFAEAMEFCNSRGMELVKEQYE